MNTRTQKWFALAAIALLAINLRTAVSSISPVVSFIQQDIPLPIITLGLLGIAAPLAFAVATSLSYRPTRKFGVEKTMTLVVAMIVLGHILRGFAWDSSALFAGSLLALLGAGMGNVLLPVMVRKYFSNRVGVISSFYITLTAISATGASLVAVPVAEAFGWRFSLSQWALLATLTILPLIALLKNSRPEPLKLDAGSKKAIWKSPTAWAIAGTQGMTSVFGYVSFAWLPLLLIEHNGVSVAEGGLLLSLFAVMGLPASLLVPILASHNPKSHRWIIWFSGFTGMAGPLGVLFGSGSALWFWVILIGLGPTMFPLALTLFNLRSRERSTVLSVSAFGQGVSYVTATIAIFTVGIMREITGGWEFALWLLFGFAALSVVLGIQIGKNHYVDDELQH
ncbi:MAG: MFS transporter [Aquiluna sp.]|nr:MFS transporter [Aquiluna sp.]MCF8545342.1 MFS transporter [Aquiluna sp.]